MMANSTDTAESADLQLRPALIGALGVVFGDIGTSPLYALRESFAGNGTPALDTVSLLGTLSLILWALVLVISIKYLMFVLRADNQGEGGIIALVALLNPWRSTRREARYWLMLMGLFGACLLYGDGTITPAISVLSAVEGLHVALPALSHYVVPLTLLILVVLFSAQRYGTGRIGRFFGPLMLVWFVVLAALGLRGILLQPSVLEAFNPWYAVTYLIHHGDTAFLTLGAVFLVVTGGEALYADLGHFGIKPIRYAWLLIVFPALVLNYLGQAALVMQQPETIQAPFFHLAPDWAVIPLVLLATVATIIASQAVISGTFSLTRQAIHLRQLPRMQVLFPQAESSGQVYLPVVNWLLMGACLALVVGFGSSDRLASAYGVAVSMDMVITTLLAVAVARRYGWHLAVLAGLGLLFLTVDGSFLAANLAKIPDGGWYALLVAGFIFVLMLTWRAGRRLLAWRLADRSTTQDDFLARIEADPPYRVPGAAVVLTSDDSAFVPPALLHHMSCTRVLHERVILLTVVTADRPHVPASERLEYENLGLGIFRLRVTYGFSQPPNIPVALKLCDHIGLQVDVDSVVYLVARETLIARRDVPGLPFWQERLFVWLARNAGRATAYYQLPEGRVLELGLQVWL
jgi:KUP system potassium uptake protein